MRNISWVTVLALCLVIAVMAGCAKQEDEGGTAVAGAGPKAGSGGRQVPSEPAEPPEGAVTVVSYYPGNADHAFAWEVLNELKDKYGDAVWVHYVDMSSDEGASESQNRSELCAR